MSLKLKRSCYAYIRFCSPLPFNRRLRQDVLVARPTRRRGRLEAAGVVDGYMVAWAEIDAYFVDNIAVDPARQGRGLGRKLMAHAADEAKRRHLLAIRLYTNAAMTENLSMYAHMEFIEIHRVVEKGFARVYMRWTLPAGEK